MLLDFLKGLVIGMGTIAPGVSGGTLAVIFGIYEKITDAIANLFHGFWKKVREFFFLGLGGVVGILGFSNIISFLFRSYELEVKYLFMGLMIGTFPSLRRQADKQGFRLPYLIPFVITLTVAVLFSFLNNSAGEMVSDHLPHFFSLAVYGAIIGFGTIIPGISASFILMYVGAYGIMMEGIAGLNLAILIPAGMGFLVSVFGFAKLINLSFKKAYGYVYYGIFGLTIGSVLSIFPGFGVSSRYILCYVILVAGCAFSYVLSDLRNMTRLGVLCRGRRQSK